uniref:NADH:ubiquinone reductase (H(+)-translocating) n=1 Tax=Xiphinema americanum TaxID=208518 RepID=Q6TY91_XIPAM|nr:NADH dehydrogenase subunit 5 [Xiphinema americanum]AAQ75781.1 NADH dehydrogenase subunit 5 [Xiphinema americanum]
MIWNYLLACLVMNFKTWFYYIWFLLCCLLIPVTSLPFKIVVTDFISNVGMFSLSILGNMQVFVFLVLVIVISLCVFSWSRFYMHNKSLSWFFSTLFIFVLSMIMLIFSESLFFIFLGWEGLGVSSFLLIIFYQNWMSVNGGLLTLLTNRVGDACLIISFSYWMFLLSPTFNLNQFLIILVFILAFTKSAQWPFTSWLPAAMAAPTPVSALVHSSTLVTAGIWMLIRFFYNSSSILWLLFGSLTTLMASLAALLEADTKKIVALSTLSQLGMMVLSLYLGGKLICFFHLVCHALAKANLFLIVGSMLSLNYSQQDSRKLSVSINTLSMALLISILSLGGTLFQSGMYSKEQILLTHFVLSNSVYSWMILTALVTLTLSYCLKLFFMCLWSESEKTLTTSSSVVMHLPILVLSMCTLVFGYFYNNNTFINVGTFSSYWVLLFMFFFFASVSFPLLFGFSLQLLVSKSAFMLGFFKYISSYILMLEPIYFIFSNIFLLKTTLSTLTPLTIILLVILFV